MPRPSIHDPKYRRLLNRLKAARESAELTQLEASKRLRKPPNYVNRIETGERRIQVLDLGELARIYNKPLRFFLPESPSEHE